MEQELDELRLYVMELEKRIEYLESLHKDITNDIEDVRNQLYIDGNKLKDVNGNDVVMRGVNIALGGYPKQTKDSIKKAVEYGCNAVRVWVSCGYRWGKTELKWIEQAINVCRFKKILCVIDLHDFLDKDEPTLITEKAVNYWLSLKDLLNANKDCVIVNIANEWLTTEFKGQEGTKYPLWSPTYQSAIKSLRDGGIENVLMVDGLGWSQEVEPLAQYCQEVLGADETGNTMFSIHAYATAEKDEETIIKTMELMGETGVCWCYGEFGTCVDKPQGYKDWQTMDEKALMKHSELNGIGYFAWSWYGNTGYAPNSNYLDLVEDYKNGGLTNWGEIAFNDEYGIRNTSKSVSIIEKEEDKVLKVTMQKPLTEEELTAKQINMLDWYLNHTNTYIGKEEYGCYKMGRDCQIYAYSQSGEWILVGYLSDYGQVTIRNIDLATYEEYFATNLTEVSKKFYLG